VGMMNIKVSVLFIFLLTSMFLLGVYVGVKEVFPFSYIQIIKQKVIPIKPVVVTRKNEQIRIHETFSSKVDIAFLGDSITSEAEWGEYFPEVRVANRGVGSEKTSDILLRLDSVLSTNPNKVFTMIGTNDVLNYVRIDKILSNYEEIVSLLKQAGTEVIIQSTVQCDLTICGSKHVESINMLNEGLKKIATYNDVLFIDLGVLSDQQGLDTIFTSDGIHLSAEGYLLWVKTIAPYIESN
tara:strand:- start:256 stop:972 length:717 start_codon:yes stop_codon:yes gene_type:complete